jgi:hypothetical protein
MPANENQPRHLMNIASHPEYADMIQRALIRTTAAFASTPSWRHTALLKKIIDESDACIGVYNAPMSPQGWGHLIIKGERALTRIVETGQFQKLRLAAISCREPEVRPRTEVDREPGDF